MSAATAFKDFSFKILLFLFVGVVMIDPTNKLLHLKEVAFVLLIISTTIFQKGRFYKDVVLPYMSLFLLATLSLGFGTIIYQIDIIESLPYFKALMFGVVFWGLAKLSIEDLLKMNFLVGLALSSFISIMLLAFLGGFFDMSSILDRLADSETVMIARRDLLGMEIPMFFYKTMPFCFFSLIYAIRKKYYIPSIIILMPIVYGGSRTPMLMALAIIAYVLYDGKTKTVKYILAVVFALAFVYLISLLTSKTYTQEGDALKSSVANYLFNNSSLFSHGVGCFYWDPGRREMTSSTEVTYFEMLYQYGWVLFPFVIYIFVRPLFKLYRKENAAEIKDFAIAYLLYLINAGTNPLLINSTGMYVFACALTITAKVHEQQVSKRKNLNYNFAQ